MGEKVVLSVGTAKGLFLFTSDPARRRWRVRGPMLPGLEINHATIDPRTTTLYATANSPWYGSRLTYSTNLGRSWQEASGPSFPKDSGLKLDRIWHIEPGPAAEPKVLFCGVAPAALFRSDDGGKSWEEVDGLTSHPSRPRWEPGAGGLCLHSILIDETNPSRMWVGISAVGVFRTEDGGKSWTALNQGVRAEFRPDKYPEFGQCVHDVVFAGGGDGASAPQRLYQQNHCGVYRSDDGAGSWKEITEGLPSDFGFPIAAHPRNPDVAYVVPLQGAELRSPPEGKLRVWRTRNAGGSWEPLSNGLPQTRAFMGLYREAFTADAYDPAGLYLGTNTGNLYASTDEGETWRKLTTDLPPVYSLSVTSID